MSTPHVVIPSYLGATPDKRKLRFGFHLRQRQTLRLHLKTDFHIVTVGSGWGAAEKDAIVPHLFHDLGSGRVSKHKVIDRYLEELYASPVLKAILFLDDDVVPRDLKPGDAESGMMDTWTTIRHLLARPEQMGAPLAYFATTLRFDAFWRANPAVVEEAPKQVMGWAILVRSDLGVRYTDEIATDGKGHSDDLPFRAAAWAAGKSAVKYNRVFFKTFQGTGDTKEKSVWFDSHAARLESNAAMTEHAKRLFPQFYTQGRVKPPAAPSPPETAVKRPGGLF